MSSNKNRQRIFSFLFLILFFSFNFVLVEASSGGRLEVGNDNSLLPRVVVSSDTTVVSSGGGNATFNQSLSDLLYVSKVNSDTKTGNLNMSSGNLQLTNNQLIFLNTAFGTSFNNIYIDSLLCAAASILTKSGANSCGMHINTTNNAIIENSLYVKNNLGIGNILEFMSSQVTTGNDTYFLWNESQNKMFVSGWIRNGSGGSQKIDNFEINATNFTVGGEGVCFGGKNCPTAAAASGGFSTNQDLGNLNKTANVTFNGVNITRYLNIGDEGNTSNMLTIKPTSGVQRLVFQSDGKLCIGQTGCLPASSIPFQVITQGGSGIKAVTNSSTATTGPLFQFSRMRGSIHTPISATTGDQIFTIQAGGHDGTAERFNAMIGVRVDGLNSSNNIPLSMFFQTGSASTNNRIKLNLPSSNPIEINDSVRFSTRNFSRNFIDIVMYEDTDIPNLFQKMMINGTIMDECSSGFCFNKIATSREIFAVNASGAYYSLGKGGKTTSYLVAKSSSVLGVFTTVCSQNFTGGILTTESTC